MDIKDFEPLFTHWYVDAFIGSGSFGKVYRIKREEFGATYYSALKWISIPQDDAELKQLRYNGMDESSITGYYRALVGKLTNEMQIMSRLRGHSNIVSYEDHQIVPKKSGVGYDVLIRMELLTSLNEYVHEKPCTRGDVIQLGIDICNALEICQRYNIIHRDIKPDNIFVSETGNYKLGDFGIARQLEHTATELSKKGTYHYMAPEVYKAQQYDSTVDLYSLGIVMYRLLNGGRLPFLPLAPNPILPNDNEQSLVRRMSGEAMPVPKQAEGRLGEIILKACAYDPKGRYSSPKQMREELQAIQFSKNEEKVVFQEKSRLGYIEPSKKDAHAHREAVEPERTESVFRRESNQKPENRSKSAATDREKEERTQSVFSGAPTGKDNNRKNVGKNAGKNISSYTIKSKRKNTKLIISAILVSAIGLILIIKLNLLTGGSYTDNSAFGNEATPSNGGMNLLPQGSSTDNSVIGNETTPSNGGTIAQPVGDSQIRIGAIILNDENTYSDAAVIDGINAGAQVAGIGESQIFWRFNIPEDETCYDTAIDLVEQGCTYIFSDSYGHQLHMQKAASENPGVTFVALSGDTAAASGLQNFKNVFPHTFESRYVSGVVAGMKLKELMDTGMATDPYVGYVGAYSYAEVISGYTAFFLGIRSIVPDAHMDVIYTNSWYNPTLEADAANTLMARGAIIISQHSDSTGAPSAVQAAYNSGMAVFDVCYNIDLDNADLFRDAPTVVLTSAQNNWGAYFTYAFACALEGVEIVTDWSQGYAYGANMISQLGPNCAPGTAEKVAEVEAKIEAGTLNVFDTASFTMDGGTVISSLVFDTDGDGKGDSGEAVIDGIFYESYLRSAPYFDIRIDGITELS